MNTKTIEGMLASILKKLESIEAKVTGPTDAVAKTSADAVLREKLDRVTIKRHAVLTATLGGVSYDQIASLMQCSSTTVKLHLKGVLDTFDIPNRNSLLVKHKEMLDSISDKEYRARYGISKKWWLEHDKALMDVLTSTKPTSNQHTKGAP